MIRPACCIGLIGTSGSQPTGGTLALAMNMGGDLLRAHPQEHAARPGSSTGYTNPAVLEDPWDRKLQHGVVETLEVVRAGSQNLPRFARRYSGFFDAAAARHLPVLPDVRRRVPAVSGRQPDAIDH